MLPLRSNPNEAGRHGPDDRVDAVGHAELVEDALEVGLDGAPGAPHRPADLGVGEAAPHQLQHLALLRVEAERVLGRVALLAAEVVPEPTRELRLDDRPAV